MTLYDSLSYKVSCTSKMDSKWKSLERDGYCVLSGVLSKEDMAAGLSAYTEAKDVDYAKMDIYIREHMFRRINEQLGTNMIYTKFRPSDNNNSSDASTFHRDVVCLGEHIPVFTCLTYFDGTEMEVIPGSHRFTPSTLSEGITLYQQRTRVTIRPGDVLVFYSTMLHRGIFTDVKGRRRLVQVFDCFKSEDDFSKYARQIIHIESPPRQFMSGIGVTIAKMPGIIDVGNTVAFINAAYNYGGAVPTFPNSSVGNRTAFSSEGVQYRVPLKSGLQPSNQYCFQDQSLFFTLPSDCRSAWSWSLYTRQFLMIIVAAILIGVGIYFGVRYGISAALRKRSVVRRGLPTLLRRR